MLIHFNERISFPFLSHLNIVLYEISWVTISLAENVEKIEFKVEMSTVSLCNKSERDLYSLLLPHGRTTSKVITDVEHNGHRITGI